MEEPNSTPPNTFQLPEFPSNPDPFFKDYDYFHKNHTPIVIDNGSYECRAGYVGEMNPRLSFRSLIAKVRTRTGGLNETRIYVGNDIKDSEIVKLGARSPFDQNLVYSFDWQENVFDHVFSRLGIENDKVDNPILMTEPICNPTYCRKNMSEMLFECYRVPSVCYGLDSLFSLYHNAAILPKHSLIVSSGYTCTHLVPVNEYYFNPTNCKRLNVGGFHSSELMRKVLSLKYSFHKNFVTPTRAQLLKEQHCYFAENYTEELAKYGEKSPSSTHIIQLPFVEQMSAAKLEEERLRKIQTRKEQGQRLKEYSERKRRDKLAEQEERLAHLKDILNSIRDKDNLEGFDRLEMEGFGDEDELVTSIAEIEDQVKKTKKRMGLGGDEKEEEEEEQEQPEPENLYPLLDIPDDQLNEVQKKEKRKQRFLKNMRDGRVQQQKKKKLEEEKKIAAQKAEEERRLANPEEFIGELRSKRKALLELKEQRTKIRAQLTSNSGRRTAADRQRLRLLTQLESGETKKRKNTTSNQNDEDNFGANDEDWQIYLAVAGDQQFKEEEEDEDAQLLQIDNLLAKHDPEFQATTTTTIPSSTSPLIGLTENVPTTAADYQIHLGVERIRIPEVLYQPPIIGVEQMGLSESMIHTLVRYPKEIQEEMVKNIFCTGGNVSYPGFLTRLENEVRMIRPFKSPFKISLARDPVYDTWRGMSEWVTNNLEEFTQVSITKKEYDEMGPNYLKRFFASNISLPYPK